MFKFVLIFILSVCSLSFAQVSIGNFDVLQSHNAEKNYVLNPSALKNASGGVVSSATLTRGTTDKIDKVASWSCDTSALSGYCEWTLATINDPDTTGSCEARVVLKGDASLYRFQLLDGSGNLLNDSGTLASYTSWQPISVTYPCGTARKVRLTQTVAGTSPAVSAGRVYYGPNTNLGTASQATFVGSIKWTGATNCSWSVNSASFINFAADTDCSTPTVTGSVTAPGTKIPGLVIANAAPGIYFFAVKGMMYGSTSTEARFRLSDGTNATSAATVYGSSSIVVSGGSLTGDIALTSPQTNWTVQMQGLSAGSTTAVISNPTTDNAFEISVYRFPTATQTVTPNPLTFYPTYSARIVAGASCTLATDVVQTGSWITGCTRAGSGAFTLDVSAGTFSTTPICTVTPLRALANNRYTISSWFTSISSSQLIMQWGYNDDQGGTIAAAIANVDDSATFHITCTSTTPTSAPSPLFMGSVTSNTSGTERIERATINLSSATACSVSAQSGNWITGTSATGSVCTLTISGFSGFPACVISRDTKAAAIIGTIQVDTTTQIETALWTTAGAAALGSHHIMCMGPK